MKFTVYRARERFVVSPDCMQAPIAVQQAYLPICQCGTIDVATECAEHLASAVVHDGFAIIEMRDQSYDVIDRICTERSGREPWRRQATGLRR